MRIGQKDGRDERGVAKQRDSEFYGEGVPERGGRIVFRLDKVPDEDPIQSEGRDDGEDAHESESESERTKEVRPKMTAERDRDHRQTADASAFVQKGPGAV